MNPALQDVAAQALAPLGYHVFALRQRGSRSRPVLEIRIERADGEPITVNDCAVASRAIEERLDADRSLAGELYTLEVSSPGIRDDAEINWKKR